MGLFDDVGSFVSDAVDTGAQIVSDGVDAIGGAAEDSADFVGDVATSLWNRGEDAMETVGKGVYNAFDGMYDNLVEAGKTISDFPLDLFDGRIADAYGDLYSGIFKAFVQTPVDAALMLTASGVSAVETVGGVEPLGRAPSAAELAELKKVFGDSIDYSKIRIKEGDNLMTLGGSARTIGNTIYIPEGKLPNNALLVHEATHVWQFQQGGDDYMSESLFAQSVGDGYNYQQAISEGKQWSELNPEQQGDLIRDAYRNGYFNSTPGNWMGNPNMTTYMNNVLPQLRAGTGTP